MSQALLFPTSSYSAALGSSSGRSKQRQDVAAVSLPGGPAQALPLRHTWRRRGVGAVPTAAKRRVAAAAIRGVESFDSSFTLDETQSITLNELLYSDLFSAQVVRDCKLPEGTRVAFTGVLFQPRPWTPTETKGMPKDIEEQYYGQEEFTFINVPPVFMFQAKISQPPRLCAVYQRV